MFKILVTLRRLARTLWMRVALFAVLAVVSVVSSHLIAPYLPGALAGVRDRIGPETVMPILSILSSSMLAVSTFSLATMVSAHHAAGNSATPRVLRLLTADRTTHTVLATFIGAFVYSLTALILFHAGFTSGALIVMAVTVVVTGGVVVALVRWIAHLTDLGTLGDALARTQVEARQALSGHRKRPALGASVLTPDLIIPQQARTLLAPQSGILQMIDVEGLGKGAVAQVWVLRRPGQTVLRGMPLARYAGTPSDKEQCDKELAEHFVIGETRTFEQDPAFALTVMTEIGARALSPGINDSGTAIEVISRLERLLWDWGQAGEAEPPTAPDLYIPALCARDLIDAAFDPLARDGADRIEVAAHLLDALNALANGPDEDLAEAAKTLATRAQEHARMALSLQADRDRLPALSGSPGMDRSL